MCLFRNSAKSTPVPFAVSRVQCIMITVFTAKKTKIELPQKQLKTPYFREQDKGEPHFADLTHLKQKRDTRFERKKTSNKRKMNTENEWFDKALEYYEKEKSQNPDYLSFDNAMIKTFARRIVGQIKEQMKLDNEQCELLLKVIFRN